MNQIKVLYGNFRSPKLEPCLLIVRRFEAASSVFFDGVEVLLVELSCFISRFFDACNSISKLLDPCFTKGGRLALVEVSLQIGLGGGLTKFVLSEALLDDLSSGFPLVRIFPNVSEENSEFSFLLESLRKLAGTEPQCL